jgi:hypothetical protein
LLVEGSSAWFVTRRLGALALTVVRAPTIVWTVFNGLRGHVVAAVVISSPPYWLGFLVLIWFAPGTGYVLELPFVSALMDYEEGELGPLGWLKALWLPWVLVGLPLAAGVMRMVVVTLRDTVGEDFIRTARAKGLPPGPVLRPHASRPRSRPSRRSRRRACRCWSRTSR